MIQAVLFDLDGLLADSEPLQQQAWQIFLSHHGHTLRPAVFDRMFGLRIRESAEVIRSEFGLPFPVEQIVVDRDQIFLGLVENSLQPMPYACEAVTATRQLGFRTALATSGHRRYVARALHHLQLTRAFDAIVTGDTVPRGKPAPDIFLRAAELLDVPPATCAVVEDAPHGIAAARAAGMYAIAVPNSLTQALDFSQADMICPSLQAFSRWIAQQKGATYV